MDVRDRANRSCVALAVAAAWVQASIPAGARADDSPAQQQRRQAREVFGQLIAFDTSQDNGQATPAARALARRFRSAGFPARDVAVVGPNGRKQNLVVRLRGTGRRRPLLLLGHLDVVSARAADWTVPPFQLTERDGYFYGRGVQDMKSLDAFWVAHLLRLKRERRTPDRDVILALTADEEDGPDNGVEWLLAHHRDLIDAQLALNEGGGGEIKDGRRRANVVQASEKTYFSLRLEAHGKGGHSSLPDGNNVIVRLGEALGRVGRLSFPARLDAITRQYFARTAALETGPAAAAMRQLVAAAPEQALDPAAVGTLAAWPFYAARLRTTCVPTRIEGGHADNALPQSASAIVNCRLLPTDDPANVQNAVVQAVADPQVSVTPVRAATPGPPSRLDPELMALLVRVTERHWPGVPVIPTMSPGASDGRFLRAAGIPTYGVSGLFHDVADVRAHGRDERIAVQSFDEALAFTWDLVNELAFSPAP